MYFSRISSDYPLGSVLPMVLLHWLFFGKEWKINLVMGFLIGMWPVLPFVILDLRLLSFSSLLDYLWLLCLSSLLPCEKWKLLANSFELLYVNNHSFLFESHFVLIGIFFFSEELFVEVLELAICFILIFL